MRQHAEVALEWGEAGAAHLGPWAEALVVIDVLSFSTCVDVATARGMTIIPLPWRDSDAIRFAETHDAVLAARRGEPGYTLSPASFANGRAGERVVLPSPNGARVTIVSDPIPTYVACLRNARAVASAVAKQARRIGIVPAGERWPDERLRPCLADHLGAGAVIAGLGLSMTPEAAAADAIFRDMKTVLDAALHQCASGQYLIERGYAIDVEVAAQLNVSDAVPMMHEATLVNTAR
ncbi:MAG: 2-phosphosulfolactate phosphatase [Pseudomonadota bacterium]